MNIRIKILLTTVLAIVITLAGVIATVSMQLNATLVNNFEVTSKAQLERVNAYVELFFRNSLATATLIATQPLTLENLEHLTIYKDTKDPTPTVGESLPDAERQLFHELQRFERANESIALLYVGSENGGFTQTPDDTLGAGYNPPERPWFGAALAAGKPVLTEVYLSDSGESVCTAAAPIQGKNIKGVVGLDISLNTITNELAKATIGKTGFMLLMDDKGVIVNEPKLGKNEKAGWAGKEITDSSLPQDVRNALSTLQHNTNQVAEVTFLGSEWFARVSKTNENWTLVMLQQKDEIFTDALDITLDIFKVGIIILVIMAGCAFILSRSIAGPVAILANAAQQVAGGNLKAIPEEEKGFTGELGVLHKSLKSMVAKLVELIATAEGKIKEAEAALALSNQSLQKAEEAKAEGENARREGVMQTTNALSAIVGQLSDAAKHLSAELSTTDSNVSSQKMRVIETATAMSQMNSAVGEVASSISRTSKLAENARNEAIAGKKLVEDVVTSITEVEKHSITMRQSLSQLGDQVTDIGKIMSVINDIADQTNLLALNAAIEAARAGDAGRGFAVVADEVRKLAENTMQATKQVGDAINNIQKGTASNMQAMQNTAEYVEKSTQIATKAGAALNSIEAMVSTTADEVRSIATASEEQSATAEEINRSTEDVAGLANEISEGSHRAQLAVTEVAGLAHSVEEVINDLRKS